MGNIFVRPSSGSFIEVTSQGSIVNVSRLTSQSQVYVSERTPILSPNFASPVNATSASFANVAALALEASEADHAANADVALSSNFSSHASTADNAAQADNASNADHANVADSANFATLASFADSASFANSALSASWAPGSWPSLTNTPDFNSMGMAWDDFTRPDSTTTAGTASIGGVWSPLLGTWGISNNQLYSLNGGINLLGNTYNGMVQASAFAVNYDNEAPGLVFRLSDQNNFWFAQLARIGGLAEVQLHWVINGLVGPNVAALFPFLFNNTTYSLEAVFLNNTINIYIDGVLYLTHIITSDEAVLTGTGCGVRDGSLLNGSLLRWDNFVVTPFPNFVAGQFVGNLLGSASFAASASWAPFPASSSYAATASVALNVPVTSSFAVSSSWAPFQVSASYAGTASVALNVPVTSSFAVSASWAPFQVSSSYSATASIAPSYLPLAGGNITGPFTASSLISLANNISIANGKVVTFKRTDHFDLGFASQTGDGTIQVGGQNVGTIDFFWSAGRLVQFSTQGSIFSGSINALGPVSASAFKGDGTQITNIQTASFATTAATASYVNASASIASASYAQVAQTLLGVIVSSSYALTASYFASGPGSTVSTASFAQTALTSSYAVSASYAPQLPVVSSSFATSASWAPFQVSASNADTASFALNVPVTASYAVSASYAPQLAVVSSSFATSASWAPTPFQVSSSYSVTASYALNGGGASVSASYASTASLAQNITVVNAGTFSSGSGGVLTPAGIVSSSYAVTASYALNASSGASVSASYSATASLAQNTAVLNAGIFNSGSGPVLTPGQIVSASYAGTASILLGSIQSASYALTASYALNGGSGGASVTSSYALTTPHPTLKVTGSYTASLTDYIILVSGSSATASIYLPSVASANGYSYLVRVENNNNWPVLVFPSGSNSIDGFASIQLTNQRATVALTSNGGNEWIAGGSGSYSSNSAISASYSTTSSYVLVAQSASYALTASYALNGGSGGASNGVFGGNFSGSFSGSLTGSLQTDNITSLTSASVLTIGDTTRTNILQLNTAGVNSPLVVIGSGAPSGTLDVRANVATLQVTSVAGNPAKIQMAFNNSTVTSVFGTGGANQLTVGAATGDFCMVGVNKRIVFSANNGSTAQMLLDTTGNVGIGISGSTPAAQLHVAQFVSASGFLGNGAGVTGVVSSSYAATASYVQNAVSASWAPSTGGGASNGVFGGNFSGSFSGSLTGSALITGSLLATAPITAKVISLPTSAASASVELYANTRAGRPMIYSMTDTGRAYAVQNSFADERVAMVVAHGGGTIPTQVGITLSAVGTPTANTIASTNKLTMGNQIIYTTTAAASQACNLIGQRSWWAGSVTGSGGFDFFARVIHTTDVASTRFFAGLYNGSSAFLSSGEPGTVTNAKIGISLDSTDTNYQLVSNPAGGTPSKVDLGVARASGTGFDLWLYSQLGTVGIQYKVVNAATGVLIANGVLTTGIPSGVDSVGFHLEGYTVAATSAVAIGLSRVICATDY